MDRNAPMPRLAADGKSAITSHVAAPTWRRRLPGQKVANGEIASLRFPRSMLQAKYTPVPRIIHGPGRREADLQRAAPPVE